MSIRRAEAAFLPPLSIAAALTAAIGAQAADVVREPEPLSRIAQKWQDMRATELIGAQAVDPHGETLGRIEDLILAADTGEVSYAVVSFGGRLDLDNKLYTYPVS